MSSGKSQGQIVTVKRTPPRSWKAPDRTLAYEHFTYRVGDIVRLMSEDKTVTEIALILGRTGEAIRADLRKAMHEMNVSTYWGLIFAAQKEGWLPCPHNGERPPCPE